MNKISGLYSVEDDTVGNISITIVQTLFRKIFFVVCEKHIFPCYVIFNNDEEIMDKVIIIIKKLT